MAVWSEGSLTTIILYFKVAGESQKREHGANEDDARRTRSAHVPARTDVN